MTAELRSINSGPIRRALDRLDRRVTEVDEASQSATAPNPNNALGIVAVGAMTFGDGALLTTGGAMTTAIVITTKVGRRYRLQVGVRAMSANINATPRFALYDGGALVSDRYYLIFANSGYNHMETEWVVNGDGASHSYQVLWFEAQAGQVFGWSGGSYWYIEDAGPNSSPALPVAPSPPAWTPLAFTNGWTNYGGPWVLGGYRKIGDEVAVRGLVRQPTAVAGQQQLALLPAGFRPPADLMFMTYGNNVGATSGGARCDVTAAGSVIYWAPGGTTVVDYCTLNNIRFSTSA